MIRISVCLTLIYLCMSTSYSYELSINPKSVKQGGLICITADADCKVFYKDNTVMLCKGNDDISKAYIGISANENPGTHEIATEDSSLRFFNVIAVKFPFQKLAFAHSKSSLLIKKIIDRDQKALDAVLTQETNEQLWSGRFVRPVKGYTTSVFGTYRLYNGKKLGDHRGWDIGGLPAGTNVHASNSGVVVFSGKLYAYGNTVVIDHGFGINTIYMHLKKRLVSNGDLVLKSQIIGQLGNTGISTAPHLHFGASVHGVRVDPKVLLSDLFN